MNRAGEQAILKPGETLDAIGRGAVKVIQARAGYRFSIDAVLLAGFAQNDRGGVLDVGTGSGVVAFLLARMGRARKVVGVEVQPDLADRARRGVVLNGLETKVEILLADVRTLRGQVAAFDVVISNPPYRPLSAGRANPGTERARARHEVDLDLETLLSAARRHLKDGGKLKLIHPAERLAELIAALVGARLEPKGMRTVHARAGGRARMVLVEARKNGRPGIEIMAPLVLFDESGGYSAEVRRLLGEDG